mmetsp:Transcript_2618/g.4099  ORF Transcript_2618/g.4099 Transcript_2618/m.4099 type:complete len:383 (-) Transcript_2618:620-1768(-)
MAEVVVDHKPPKFDIYGKETLNASNPKSQKKPKYWTNSPKVKTRSELLEARKNNRTASTDFEFFQKKEKAPKLYATARNQRSEDPQKPKTKTALEAARKEQDRRFGNMLLEKRMKEKPITIELEAVPFKDFRDKSDLVYVEEPRAQTASQLKRNRRQEFISHNQNNFEFTKNKEVYFDYKQPVSLEVKGKTLKTIIKSRKKQDMQHLSGTFKVKVIGVHGQELPKYQDNCKEYWKLNSGYQTDPKNQSFTRYFFENKKYNKQDQLFLQDAEENPVETSKRIRPKTAGGVTDKPNNVCPFKNFRPPETVDVVEKLQSNKKLLSSGPGFVGSSSGKSRPLSAVTHSNSRSKPSRPATAKTGAYHNRPMFSYAIRTRGFSSHNFH